MEQLKKTVQQLMEGLLAKQKPFADGGPEDWLKKALTKKELGHIKVKYLSKGILGVNVDSSVWLYSLSIKKEEILSKLQKCNPEIKNINFRIGEI